ncbi:phospholipase-like protein [Tanacetum coccineum]
MDLSDIEVPRVFVTCMIDNFNIQFGREEFCLVSGLKFGVENSSDYNKAKEPIPFRRRVFSSDLDGGPITGKDVELLIESDVFKKLDDNDVVSICCVGIVQLVLLGVEDRRGQLPVERLVPDEIEARSRWWVSSRAYFDGRSFEDEQIPRHLNRNNYFEVPSEMYREFEEQRRGYQEMKENNNNMYEKITRFMEDTRRVPEANTTPIIPDQQFGASGISGFQSYQGLPSAFHTLANNSSFLNMATPSNWQTPNQSNWLSPSNWQTPNPSYLGTPNSQPPIPSPHGTSNLQNPMTSYYSPNLPPPSQDAGILDPNLCDRARREPQPSVYMLSPYTVLPPTTELPKKRIDKTKKKGNTKKLSPMNLGNTFADENVSGDDVTITGVQQTDNYFNYENVDPDKVTRDAYVTMTEFILDPYDIYLDCYMKGYKVPSFFWPQLVPHLCTYRREQSWPEGWLSSDHMNSWIQILIRERTENANWTLAKSGTVCLHQENNRFMILTDPHNIGTLDGSVRPFPSWNDVTWVYMPINAGGVHWVTGAINLADSIFYVFDSMESETRMLMLGIPEE